METTLLNPNAAAQKSAPQQGVLPVQGDAVGEFSPLLNEAVASRVKNEDQQEFADESENVFFDEATNPAITDEVIGSNLFTEAAIATVETVVSGQVSLSVNSMTDSAKGFVQSQVFSSSGIETFNSAIASEEKVSPIQPQASPAPISQTGTANELTATEKVENVLLQQIQQILDQGRNNGSIVITGSNGKVSSDQNQIENLRNLSNPLLADSDSGDIQARQIGITIPTTDETTIATQKSVKLEGAQQDVSEQYLNARLGKSKDGTADQFQQNSRDQKGADQQTKREVQITSQTPGTTVSDTKPGESSFGQQFGLNSTTNNQAVSIEGKFAPGANPPVPEREIVGNLIQRFNVNPRLQTSKLTMQLHPAELGALKIDILVKGDSIKANIVAQSQQVLETLEKHLPRLRSVLEDQGFKIDSFAITMDGDGGKQNELFQEHFNSPQQEFASNGSSSPQTDSFKDLLDSQEESNDSEQDVSGVNLTV